MVSTTISLDEEWRQRKAAVAMPWPKLVKLGIIVMEKLQAGEPVDKAVLEDLPIL